MIFVQFFNKSAIDPTQIIEACGDRSVVILDGRVRQDTRESIAHEVGVQRKFVAYQMYKGDSFTRSRPTGPIVMLGGNHE